MSQPPDYPGRRRVKRAAASLAGDAYQGAFEAVMAVLVGAGAGYWADGYWDTTPYGVLAGVVIGFAAMVLRLLRMGRELQLDDGAGDGAVGAGSPAGTGAATGSDAGAGSEARDRDDRGPAEEPAQSDVWRDDPPEASGEPRER
ncbi:MAG: AtpZ/AtpI family protein [Deltaproteobacteria bacterium]|nr:AtpZ/AtpI family protein [Deltaproteobacteria bacterium]